MDGARRADLGDERGYGADAPAHGDWLPPSHPLVAEVMVPWSNAVEEATQGRVSIEIMQAPLGPPPAHFDFAVNGIADITYGVHNYTPGRFPTTELAELPFLSDSARDLSVSYWQISDRYLKAANEQRGVQVLGVFVHGPGQLYTTKREIGSIEDLRGLKIRIGGGVAQEVAKAIGVVPNRAPVTRPTILFQGVADGIQFPAGIRSASSTSRTSFAAAFCSRAGFTR